MRFSKIGEFPKVLPPMTDEQRRIREDFYGVWLQTLPQRFGVIEKFNHTYPLRTFRPGVRTLDVGAGRGEHAAYESLDQQEYVALELRPELARAIEATYPQVRTIVGNIEERIDAQDGSFDRILAIHVLEHLTDLPRALEEIARLLHPQGQFSVLIPCDPGFAYELGRTVSARRIFERRYKTSYDWFVALEHINHYREIVAELNKVFRVTHREYFPLKVPAPDMNLVIGLTLSHKG